MSDEPIRVWDLVQVVKTCCDARVDKLIYTVTHFRKYDHPTMNCSLCGKEFPTETLGCPSDGNAHPLSWLRRIPPLSELETQHTDSEVTA